MASLSDPVAAAVPTRHAANVHRDAIAEIVAATRRDAAYVQRVYESELARLRASARVTDYVVLFAVRRTREMLADDPPAG